MGENNGFGKKRKERTVKRLGKIDKQTVRLNERKKNHRQQTTGAEKASQRKMRWKKPTQKL